MFVKGIKPASNAYDYPLLIKQILHTPLSNYPNREIVHSEGQRFTYQQFRARIGQLAHALQSNGVTFGKTVAVLDWDSHRYFECFLPYRCLCGATYGERKIIPGTSALHHQSR